MASDSSDSRPRVVRDDSGSGGVEVEDARANGRSFSALEMIRVLAKTPFQKEPRHVTPRRHSQRMVLALPAGEGETYQGAESFRVGPDLHRVRLRRPLSEESGPQWAKGARREMFWTFGESLAKIAFSTLLNEILPPGPPPHVTYIGSIAIRTGLQV